MKSLDMGQSERGPRSQSGPDLQTDPGRSSAMVESGLLGMSAGFLTPGRFLAAEPKTLYHARGFLDHSVGCNARFTGTGLSPDGEVETLVPCVPVNELVGATTVPLTITDEEVQAFQRRQN